MKRLLRSLVLSLLGVAMAAGCSGGFPPAANNNRLKVDLVLPANPESVIGSPTHRLPLSFTESQTYTLNVTAQLADGSTDTTFNGFVRASIVPGSVLSVSGANASGRNVRLVNGVATNVQVAVIGATGDARIWMEDDGYTPADPARVPPPQCSDGIDNNGNGLVDYGPGQTPVDPGCFATNDDSEDGGSFATGTTEVIHYVFPRIADVRGVAQGGAATPFPNEQVEMDTQWALATPSPLLLPRSAPPAVWKELLDVYEASPGGGYQCDKAPTLPAPPKGCSMSAERERQYCHCAGKDQAAQGVVVTGLSSSGFYATDVADPRGFASVFAYNFTAPPLMQVCDRLVTFGGTAADFFGFTEINYPAWELEAWDSTARDCFVPEPHEFSVAELGTTPGRLQQESGLVRVAQNPMPGGASYPVSDDVCTNPCGDPVASPLGTTLYSVHIGALFGPNHPMPPMYLPTADATNCDLNNDAKLDFTAGNPEATCSDACTANVECSEYSAYLSETQFNLVVENNSTTPPTTAVVLGDGSASQTFDPVASKGKKLSSFTGNLKYFSGGTQFTITARCDDDIVLDTTKLPLPSDQACVNVTPAQFTF